VPNPGAPQDAAAETGITTSAFARPVFAFDDELGPEPPRSHRRFVYYLLLLFLAVFLAGGVSGVLASTKRGYNGLDTAFFGLMATLIGFAAVVLPLVLVWLMRARFVRRAAPDDYGRVVLIVLFWILFSTLSGAAAFVLFFVACLGGLAAGEGSVR